MCFLSELVLHSVHSVQRDVRPHSERKTILIGQKLSDEHKTGSTICDVLTATCYRSPDWLSSNQSTSTINQLVTVMTGINQLVKHAHTRVRARREYKQRINYALGFTPVESFFYREQTLTFDYRK